MVENSSVLQTHIRFFYSQKASLEALKQHITEENIYRKMYQQLKIDFCLDKPLISLQEQSLAYFRALSERYVLKKKRSVLDNYDLLDSIFYLFASGYDMEKEKTIQTFLKDLQGTMKFQTKDTLESYTKVYLALIAHYLLARQLDTTYIQKNIAILGDMYPEFEFFLHMDESLACNRLAMNLSSIHRMKRIYHQPSQPKTTGYLDFANLFSTLGKIVFWKKVGLSLSEASLDELFVNEFNKEVAYFRF